MAAARELSHPPITEALVDLRIVVDDAITLDRLSSLGQELRETFPKVDERRQMTGEFRIEGGKLLLPTSRDLGFHGLWLHSEDGSRIVQFRTDGFTFNNVGLGQYMGGEALIAEALRLWSRYADVVSPVGVVRVAMRYLNSLDFPLRTGAEFKTYLTSPPDLPEGPLREVSSFLSRIVAHDESGAQAIVTQKLNLAPDPHGAVIIDLDFSFPFAEQSIAPTVDAIRPYLETLRSLKNRTFFALLTEEAVKLYT